MSLPRLLAALTVGLCLTACQSLPPAPIGDTDFQANQAALLANKDWSFKGRLNVRQANQSDTVALVWQQHAERFDLAFSSTILGLGSTRVSGTATRVTVEKSGEKPVTLPGLRALTREYLTFDFPAANLLYWVRGLPVPGISATTGFDEHSRLATLAQRDDSGREWQLQFDRYTGVGGLALPSRIRVTTGDVQLTVLVDTWQPGAAP